MPIPISRRRIIQGAAAAPALATALPESAQTPKLALEMGLHGLAIGGVEPAAMRRVRQLGVSHVLMGGPPLPWTEDRLRGIMERLNQGGLTLGNLMIGGFPKTLYGQPGRDEEIDKVRQSIRAAGKAGLPVIEYNFYAHRAMEGYYEEPGRAGSGRTSFDYSRMKDLPPLPGEGAYTLDEMWTNITYFLKAVVPVAEESNVRLALHPNDPPAPLSRGSGQIMATLAGWKKLVDIVPSKSNGITFDCGVTKEMGENPVQVARYFGARDCINHVHFRNVIVRKPYEDYAEVFIDEGEIDMFAVMRELVRQKYPRLIYPEHPRAMDVDSDRRDFKPVYPGGGGYAGFAFQVGYARAMMQAALSL
jgi:mannonate dehydratase